MACSVRRRTAPEHAYIRMKHVNQAAHIHPWKIHRSARMHTCMNDVRSRMHTPMHAQRAKRGKKTSNPVDTAHAHRDTNETPKQGCSVSPHLDGIVDNARVACCRHAEQRVLIYSKFPNYSYNLYLTPKYLTLSGTLG